MCNKVLDEKFSFLYISDFVDQLNNVMFTSSKADRVLTGHVIASEGSVGSSLQCMKYCANSANGQCKSFNHKKMTGECQLNNETGQQESNAMKTNVGYNHYYIAKSDMIVLP